MMGDPHTHTDNHARHYLIGLFSLLATASPPRIILAVRGHQTHACCELLTLYFVTSLSFPCHTQQGRAGWAACQPLTHILTPARNCIKPILRPSATSPGAAGQSDHAKQRCHPFSLVIESFFFSFGFCVTLFHCQGFRHNRWSVASQPSKWLEEKHPASKPPFVQHFSQGFAVLFVFCFSLRLSQGSRDARVVAEALQPETTKKLVHLLPQC